jgi:hypothetical protein
MEVKIRVWDKDRYEMLYKTLPDRELLNSLNKDFTMRYVETNLQKQDIYEGDIVEASIVKTRQRIKGIVVWLEDKKQFTLLLSESRKAEVFPELIVWKTAIVLGNKFENPDLLAQFR